MSKLTIKKIDLNRTMRIDVNAPTKIREKEESKSNGSTELTESVSSMGASESVLNFRELTGLIQHMEKEITKVKSELVSMTDLYTRTKEDSSRIILHLEEQAKQKESVRSEVDRSISILTREVETTKTALSSINNEVAETVKTLQKPIAENLQRIEQLKKYSIEQQSKLDQRFIDLTQYALDAHLENAAASARLNATINGGDEEVLRKQLYKGALKQGAEVAQTLELLPLAEAWDDLASKVELTGSTSDAE